MSKSTRIAIIVTYFGEMPWYFSYFVHSCKFNKEIDFILFTDLPFNDSIPSNIRIFNTSLRWVRNLASSKLNFEVSLEYPYKLSDYKPAYGLIFEDYIEGYEFWGQSDIDIIYGNLQEFFSGDFLKTNDYVNVRHDYTTGCFSLFRNTPKVNTLFKNSKDYKKVFTTKDYCAFEELNFKHCQLTTEGLDLEEVRTEIECFTHVVRKAAKQKLIKAHFDFILLEGVPGRIKFNSGSLIYKNKYEVALYHLCWLKKIYNPSKAIVAIPDIFHISPSRIYSNKKNLP